MIKKIIEFLKIKEDIKDDVSFSHEVVDYFENCSLQWANVKVVGTYKPVPMYPNKILADDELTSCFSQTDVRNLTYYAYQNMNQPKYKILANKTGERGEKLYMISEKGVKKNKSKSHKEMMEDEVRLNLGSEDSYSLASENSDQDQIIIDNISEKIKRISKKE